MNLINDQWIPVKRADNSFCYIAPWEIGENSNPVIEIAAPRPDFRGALYQFLIGLVQTAYAPADDDEWEEKWNEIPSCEELKNTFEKYSAAFELFNENGPAFMQDYSITEDDLLPIEDIVGGSLSTNTREKNRDLFTKRGTICSISPYWAALALFNVQTSAVPQWGQHRVGLRPTGPISTLLIPDDKSTLFHNIYINVLTIEDLIEVPGDMSKSAMADIFPWMGSFKLSPNKEGTFPFECNPLQHYWPMPRRIQLVIDNNKTHCDIDGKNTEIAINSYKRQVDGIYYCSGWLHPLTPYEKKAKRDFPDALTGERLQFGYRDWLLVTFGNGDYSAAKIVKKYNSVRYFHSNARLWAFGYDAVSANLKAWNEQLMPLVIMPEIKRTKYIETIQIMITAIDSVIDILQEQIKTAWFERPKDVKGDMSFVQSSFYEQTESKFYTVVEKIRDAIVADQGAGILLLEWHAIIIKAAEDIFNRYALQNTDEQKNMKRIAIAAKTLSVELRSPKNKNIQALLQ